MPIGLNVENSPILKQIYDQGAEWAAGVFLNSVEIVLNRRGIYLSDVQRKHVAFLSLDDVCKLNDLAHGASYEDIMKFATPAGRKSMLPDLDGELFWHADLEELSIPAAARRKREAGNGDGFMSGNLRGPIHDGDPEESDHAWYPRPAPALMRARRMSPSKNPTSEENADEVARLLASLDDN